MEDEMLLEPLKGYKQKYKEYNKQLVEEFFDDLVKKSGINVEENKKSVAEYNNKLKEVEEAESNVKSKKALKTFLIICSIILIIFGFILLFKGAESGNAVQIVLCFLLIGLSIFFFVLIGKKINPLINELSKVAEKKQNEANELLDTCWRQMDGLNKIYDWGMSEQLFSKTVPLIQMDQYFDISKYEYMKDHFGYEFISDPEHSMCFCESGTVLGNPFLICNENIQDWKDHVYSNSITIHWTTTESDGNGNFRTVHHSEVLTASIVKPVPYYYTDTYLVYGNDAAPNLCFSRDATDCENMSERQLQKYIKKETKKADKLASAAIKKGESFTRLHNEEFEALFGATNRNNEVEFRLLFTPLAQNNMCELIKDKDPYGDDFVFVKRKKVNLIQSEHSANINYYSTPARYVTYDYEAARKIFIDYNTTFFKGVYFDLAPLMCIPLYQQHKTLDFIYKREFPSNVSHLEHESIANSFAPNTFKPDKAETDLIINAKLVMKHDGFDTVNVTGYSYVTIPHIYYETQMGGDGLLHTIPVEWLEYKRVLKREKMSIGIKKTTREEFNNLKNTKEFNQFVDSIGDSKRCIYERGLFATLVKKEVNEEGWKKFDTFYRDKK